MLFLGVLCVLLLLYLYWHMKVHDPRQPPLFPGVLPFIGHASQVYGDNAHVHAYLVKVSEHSLRNAGALSAYILWQKVYLFTDPQTCLDVANQYLNKAHAYKFFGFVFGNGLLVNDEVLWKKHRKTINPSFNSEVLAMFSKIINSQSRKLVDQLSIEIERGYFEHWTYLAYNSFETICFTLLGLDDNIEEEIKRKYLKLFHDSQEIIIESAIRVWMHIPLLFELSSFKKRYDSIINKISNITDIIINHKKKMINEKNKKEDKNLQKSKPKFKAFLEFLLELKEDVMTDEKKKDEINTMIAAGFETTPTALMYLFLLLGSNPTVQDKVRDELIEIFENTQRDVENQDLSKMVYLEAVIKETLRLYPTVPYIGRQIDKNGEIGKWKLSKGAFCVFSIYGLHRHLAWGPDADQFRPERWLDHTAPNTSLYFMPFGVGRRNCIGKNYAMMAMKITAAHVLRRYKIEGDISTIKLKYEITLKPVAGCKISIRSV